MIIIFSARPYIARWKEAQTKSRTDLVVLSQTLLET